MGWWFGCGGMDARSPRMPYPGCNPRMGMSARPTQPPRWLSPLQRGGCAGAPGGSGGAGEGAGACSPTPRVTPALSWPRPFPGLGESGGGSVSQARGPQRAVKPRCVLGTCHAHAQSGDSALVPGAAPDPPAPLEMGGGGGTHEALNPALGFGLSQKDGAGGKNARQSPRGAEAAGMELDPSPGCTAAGWGEMLRGEITPHPREPSWESPIRAEPWCWGGGGGMRAPTAPGGQWGGTSQPGLGGHGGQDSSGGVDWKRGDRGKTNRHNLIQPPLPTRAFSTPPSRHPPAAPAPSLSRNPFPKSRCSQQAGRDTPRAATETCGGARTVSPPPAPRPLHVRRGARNRPRSRHLGRVSTHGCSRKDPTRVSQPAGALVSVGQGWDTGDQGGQGLSPNNGQALGGGKVG